MALDGAADTLLEALTPSERRDLVALWRGLRPHGRREPHQALNEEAGLDWKLEVVVVPVTDIDRAKEFYVSKLGFRLDADTNPTPDMRVVHMTPPGSACSVVIGPTVLAQDAARGSAATMQLVVTDIEAARAELAGRGIEASVQTLDPTRDGGKFMFFADPDGNNWAVQEVRERVGAPLS